MFYWLFITLSNKVRFHTIISSMRFITFWNESLSCDTVMVINSTRGWCDCDRMVVGFRTTLICNQCLSLMLWVRITIRVRCTTLGDKVCQWLGTGRWISPSLMVSSTYKTDRHDTTEILLKMVFKHHQANSNSTNINKTNNHLSQITKKTTTCEVGNPGPGLGQAQKSGMVKLVNGIPHIPSW